MAFSAEALEDLIRRHPKVHEVQVFGVPDGRQGEEICAWVVLKPGAPAVAEELMAFCRGKVGHGSAPRHIRFVAGFPVTAAGKVQTFLMRAAMLSELRAPQAKTA